VCVLARNKQPSREHQTPSLNQCQKMRWLEEGGAVCRWGKTGENKLGGSDVYSNIRTD
jgi:hypothetical protein